MVERLRDVLLADPRIAYALLFGSEARGVARTESDVDVAVGVAHGHRLDTLDIGELTSRLSAAVNRPVDLVLIDEAPPGLAFRIIRDGQAIVVRDPRALTSSRARAILEYLDFRPIEELCARGVLAARHGR